MANEALFYALGQALSQPSHAFRAARAALAVPGQAAEGLQQGIQTRGMLRNAKLMDTRLGDLFPDPGSIPGGLTPNHRVSDLLAMREVLPYVPTETGGALGRLMSGAGSPAPAAPAPVTPPAGPTSPSGTPANPLQTLQATGAGAGGNIAPGAPVPVPTAGNSGAPGVPPGPNLPAKMSMADIQRYGPLLNDLRQGRQFQQGQAAEESRFVRGQGMEESRFERGQDLARTEHGATIAHEANTAANPYDSAIGALEDLKQSILATAPKGSKTPNDNGAPGTPGINLWDKAINMVPFVGAAKTPQYQTVLSNQQIAADAMAKAVGGEGKSYYSQMPSAASPVRLLNWIEARKRFLASRRDAVVGQGKAEINSLGANVPVGGSGSGSGSRQIGRFQVIEHGD